MLEITTCVGLARLPFGASLQDVESELGAPLRRSINSDGETVLEYDGFFVRMDAQSLCFRELSMFPDVEASINGHTIDWRARFLDWLAAEDQDLQVSGAVMVSFRLGISVTGFGATNEDEESDRCITAFREGDWDDLRGSMKSFNPG